MPPARTALPVVLFLVAALALTLPRPDSDPAFPDRSGRRPVGEVTLTLLHNNDGESAPAAPHERGRCRRPHP